MRRFPRFYEPPYNRCYTDSCFPDQYRSPLRNRKFFEPGDLTEHALVVVMLREKLPRTHLYGSPMYGLPTKVPFLKPEKCAARALMVKPEYIARHIDVKANLRQVLPKLS
jgi:hypothetical protein